MESDTTSRYDHSSPARFRRLVLRKESQLGEPYCMTTISTHNPLIHAQLCPTVCKHANLDMPLSLN
jgi:hypothetical protein